MFFVKFYKKNAPKILLRWFYLYTNKDIEQNANT